LAAAASIVVLQSGAHASRRAASSDLSDVEGMLRARDALSDEPTPEDARLLRQRYEALQERRTRIGDALPSRRQPRSAVPAAGLKGAGIVVPPRMDAGDANPDGLLFFPAAGDLPGGDR
jgi:hypothetical protein